ncbi:carbonic anhydrase 3-like isoform X1 [Drosophila nasuta]|uniref:carbonic anhydrase 3-like isoform X1 n=2 Tax=Drosophila nasuta TaxID=42062 RepID=UPI00295E4365|nr:carbonic anhydrase 3-like isoform X1 [Drosophila nasuta]
MSKLFCQLWILLLFASTHGVHIDTGRNTHMIHWNHDQNGRDWEGLCKTGKSQSPIELSKRSSEHKRLPNLNFQNYFEHFGKPSVLKNTGYSCSFKIGKTRFSENLEVSGADLKGTYIAEELHFHWGSMVSKGAEHIINGRRYDVEIHVVHRRSIYNTMQEAILHPDGLAVLAIMIRIPDYRESGNYTDARHRDIHRNLTTLGDLAPHSHKRFLIAPPSIEEFLRLLIRIREYHSTTLVHPAVTVGIILKKLEIHNFYSYHGSLTTPDCQESVHWIVFREPLIVKLNPIFNIFLLRNVDRKNVLNNFRVSQPIYNRKIIYNI